VETIGEEMTGMSFYFEKQCKCDDICMNAMKMNFFKKFQGTQEIIANIKR
jgi:hypothetical protein